MQMQGSVSKVPANMWEADTLNPVLYPILVTRHLIECVMQMQGNVGKRPANMWGAVPQHHHAVPPPQPQHSQAQHSQAQHSQAQHSQAQHSQAQAQQFALAQAAAQAQAMRHAEGAPPPPPPNTQMGGYGHARWVTLPTSYTSYPSYTCNDPLFMPEMLLYIECLTE